MKKSIILIVVLSMISFSAFSQKNPPENVKKELYKKYATAQSIKWDNEEKNEWEAEFTMEGKKMSASFDNSGKWLESETVINEKELPASVEITLNKDFTGYKKGETSLEVIFDNKGNILKKTIIKDEDEKSEKVEK
jgi:hypothetical protein